MTRWDVVPPEERCMLIQQGSIIAGKLRLERPLAQGGMGSIWIAHHLSLDLDVAVKFMGAEIALSESARTRFEREARASVLIKSPHVVQVFDYGIEENTPYIVMELLEGEDLAGKLHREGRQSLQATYRILDPVCRALKRAHDVGLVHRDLKPGNIFLARSDDDEIVKILDFGIAKTTKFDGSPSVTKSHSFLGSPAYMSAEQINRSKDVDLRSDLWSLGVILYEMLTGHVPFEQEDFGALLVAICTEPFQAPSSWVPELGPEVDRFFERALSRDLATRFQNARELADAFAKLAGLRTAALSQPATQEIVARGSGDFPRPSAVGEPRAAVSTDPAGAVNPEAATVSSGGATTSPSRPPAAAARTIDKVALSVTGSEDARATPRRSRAMIVGIGGGALAAVAAIVATIAFRSADSGSADVASLDHSQPVVSAAASPAAASPASPAMAPADAPAELTVRLAIAPADATVEVNARAVPVKDGAVELRGKPGSEQQVRVRKDQLDTTVSVALAESGPTPAKIDLGATLGRTAPAEASTAGAAKTTPAARQQPASPSKPPSTKKGKDPSLSRQFE
jgi:eukaryotic-like serine/threonine-protein kinase